jgi:BlaI family penicillinase repressor
MGNVPRISEAEWEVMEVLWRKHPLTALEVVRQLASHKAVGFEAEGNVYHYRPLVTRDQCVQKVSQSFLERVFEGATASLLIHFVEKKSLTHKELAELEAILRQKRKGR